MEISENSFISRVRKFARKSNTVIRSIGDDGAVAELNAGQYVFVQDAMVEHVHFDLSFMDMYHLGKKALYSNISDVLAMGAEPLFYMVTTGIPAALSSGDLMKAYRGMDRAAREFGVTLLGGDTVSTTGGLFIDISVIGRLIADEYCGRDKARPGDHIAVTGKLGEAAFGLKLLKTGGDRRGYKASIERFLSPKPPHALWKELVKNDITHAMMDVSDGLIMDLSRMMDESGTAARIDVEKVPMPRPLRRQGLENLALSGGEDYQLLFTFPRDRFALIEKMIKKGRAITVIGEVHRGRGVRVYREGKEIDVPGKGYDHFGGTT